jgi:hypothetical protein
MAEQNPEFSLHVHKKVATAEHRDLYTIGIWKDSTLHAICHAQPLEQALGALRNVLDQAGKPQTACSSVRRSEIEPGIRRTGWQKIVAAMLASLGSLVKSAR